MMEWLLVGAVIACILLIILSGLPRSHARREIGFSEGIDDASVGEAFNAMQNLPQFKLVRGIIIQHVTKPKIGEPLAPESSLLDLGCGTGHLLLAFHEAIASKKISALRLHGIDIGTESVRLCRDALANAGIDDIDVREGDGANMPYADATFDVIVTSLSLHHWTSPPLVFDEIYRVLRPGGLLVLFDMRRDCRKNWHRLLRFATRAIVPKPLRAVREPLGSLLASYTKAELQDILSTTSWAKSENIIESVMFAQVLEARKP
ncbi:MAG TPA: class I SAM-dependent methyltransferase [Candidatus Lokiarchaeia archaeon]|nr:class I SAM-dependent methyltransferase [Candidatus Lokiarchaeia archaeon]